MKYLALLVLLLSLPVSAAARRGNVFCDTTAPKQQGFSLIALRATSGKFTGSQDVGGVRIRGVYRPEDEMLALRVVETVEDSEEDGATLAETNQRLLPKDFLRLSIGKRLEVFCRVLWN